MSIRDWPPLERPREKLVSLGANRLSNAELLALFLGCGRHGQNTVDSGREILAAQGGLKRLLDTDPVELIRVKGLGMTVVCRLLAGLEMGRRYLGETLQREDAFTEPSACAAYLQAQLVHYPYEVFACLFLDNHHRVIAFEELFRGSVLTASVHPREVVRRCLVHNATGLIFAHNHPSGMSEPSPADRVITEQLQQALALIEVRVLDHFIIGRGSTTSMAQLGWL